MNKFLKQYPTLKISKVGDIVVIKSGELGIVGSQGIIQQIYSDNSYRILVSTNEYKNYVCILTSEKFDVIGTRNLK